MLRAVNPKKELHCDVQSAQTSANNQLENVVFILFSLQFVGLVYKKNLGTSFRSQISQKADVLLTYRMNTYL